MIVKARANGADYLYSLLTSYEDAPAGIAVPEGMYYNSAYSGHMIAMPQPLYGDDVEYADGADTSMDAVAKDLVNFMAWTAEPALEERKRTGVAVISFWCCYLPFFRGYALQGQMKRPKLSTSTLKSVQKHFLLLFRFASCLAWRVDYNIFDLLAFLWFQQGHLQQSGIHVVQ